MLAGQIERKKRKEPEVMPSCILYTRCLSPAAEQRASVHEPEAHCYSSGCFFFHQIDNQVRSTVEIGEDLYP